jgi:hypothetical protein
MTPNKKFALSLAAGLAFCSAAIPARAQGTTAPITISKPAETPNAKTKRAEFQVLHMMSNAIQVQSVANLREIHTFVYSDGIRGEMQNLFNRGGYQYGDKVKIVYQPGSEIALEIKGRPSKPKTL